MPSSSRLRRLVAAYAAAVIATMGFVVAAAAASPAATCSVSPATLDFGYYDPIARTAKPPAVATIRYRCREVEGAVHVRIRVLGGVHDRFMKNTDHPGDRLYYDLSFPPTTRGGGDDGEGDGTIFNSRVSEDRSDGPHTRSGSLPVYAVVRPRQDIRAGHYMDTVTVVIEFEL